MADTEGLIPVNINGVTALVTVQDAMRMGWSDKQTLQVINIGEGIADFIHASDLEDEIDNIEDAQDDLYDARVKYYQLLGSGTTAGADLLAAVKNVDRAQRDLDRAQTRSIGVEMRNLRVQALAAGGRAVVDGSGGGMGLGIGGGGNAEAFIMGGLAGYFLRGTRSRPRKSRRDRKANNTVPA
jgi:hypothetical protein